MQTIRSEIAENAVRATRLAAGRPPTLTGRQHRQIDRLVKACRAGRLTRADIAARIDNIARGTR